MRAMYAAATGMMAQELNVQVISNNIANMRTTGFKRQRADFQDLLYDNIRRQGATTSDAGTQIPVGIQVGAGVRTAATPRVMSQGSVLMTEKDTDVAIQGEGFFRVTLPDGRTAYTRDGAFELDSQGQIVTKEGYLVEGGITVPANSKSFTISSNGSVQVVATGQTTSTEIGKIQLARFINKTGLENVGENLYLETASSGTAQVSNPGDDGTGKLLQKYLEQSNVNAVTDIAELITAQRAYEMNARVISAADEMLRSTTGMFR